MQKDEKLLTEVTDYLYHYLEDTKDEELPEAKRLLSRLETQKDITPQWISTQLREIFTETFDHVYEEDAFDQAGQDLFNVVKREK